MLIGLTGGLAAGKSEAAKFFSQHGFKVLVFSDVLRHEAALRGIAPTRENLQDLGIQIRKETQNDAILAEKLLLLVKGNCVVDGIRNTAEIDALSKHPHFVLLGITAPADIRYKRLQLRKRLGDPQTYSAFVHLDNRELKGETPAFEIQKCLSRATIISNEQDFATFHSTLLNQIKH